MNYQSGGKGVIFNICTLVFLLIGHLALAHNLAEKKQYSVEEGLASNSITSLIQDSKGFIWIGTTNGMSRFDGRNFINYKNTPFDSTTIPGNGITTLREDLYGSIWAGTMREGYVKIEYSGLVHRQTKIPYPQNKESYILHAKRNGLVVLGSKRSVSIYVSDSSVVNLSHPIDSVEFAATNQDRPVCCDLTDGDLIIGVGKRLYFFDALTRKIVAFADNSPLNGPITSLTFLDNNTFLVGSEFGLYLAKKEGAGLKWVSFLPDLSVTCMVREKLGNIIVGSPSGIKKVRISENNLILLPSTEVQEKFEFNSITSLLEDTNGIIWIGTKHQGLFKLNPSNPLFSTKQFYHNGFDNQAGVLSVTSLIETQNGDILFGSDRGKLTTTDVLLTYQKPFFIKNADKLNNLQITSLHPLPNNDLLIGTNESLFLFSNLNKEIIPVFDDKVAISSFLESGNGDVYIASSKGVLKYANTKILQVGDSLLNATCLTLDKADNLWIGTENGLWVFLKSDGFVKKVTAKSQTENKQLCYPILTMDKDSLDNLWIGTANGLFFYSKDSSSIHPFNAQDPRFVGELITNISCDKLGRTWVTTQNSVLVITNNDLAYAFRSSSEMNLQDISLRSSLMSKSSKLYLGGDKGISVIDLKHFDDGVVKPRVTISQIKWQSKKLSEVSTTDAIHRIEVRGLEELKIKFELALNDYRHPEMNTFKYRIRGAQNNWVQLGSNNTATFYQLATGDYIIEFQGCNSVGVWAEEPMVFHLTITPPLFKSGFAIVFYLLALLFIGQIIYSFGFRYLRRTKKSLAEEKISKRLFEAQSVKLALINKSLTDSIDYAKRIQVALLPNYTEIRKILPKSFVLFKPKDIVSGDFYAVFEKNNHVIVAVADCTGHGVPGAFMSMIGFDMLKNIINVQRILDPAEILKIMNNEVVSMLRHGGATQGQDEFDVNDGMDMAVCVIDRSNRSLRFSGAINPLYLIRNNEILNYKGSRYSVGHTWIDDENVFQTEVVELENDDACYMFSDGFVDQFGGSEGKKFKFRRFRHLLLQIHRLPHSNQHATIKNMMRDWMSKGNYPQVDDMLILGFNPLSNED